ncbi:MAG: hypothetical protein CMN30_14235 [Sandaracinus sp.]|nr:hypothetical protein [Sandaracinus sp.]|tara:strand:- start:1494 stop:1928 length:435 start_codon:yes stop_codon:yes gene_type:complete
MSTHRLFVAQDVLDRWMVDEAVSVEGDVMTLDGNQRFRLLSAVCFTEELTGEGDPHELIGRVKDLETLSGLGGEHVSDSVILGDNAYTVVEGFLGEPLEPEPDAEASGSDLASATLSALGEKAESSEIDLLAQFFLDQLPGKGS